MNNGIILYNTDDGELCESVVCNYKLHTTEHGAISTKTQIGEIAYYNGKISKEQMKNKVDIEYKKFNPKTLSKVEKDYPNEIKAIEQKAKEGNKNE